MADLAQAAVLLGAGHQAAPHNTAGIGPACHRGSFEGPEVVLPPITRYLGFSPLLHPGGLQGHTFREATHLPGREGMVSTTGLKAQALAHSPC